MAQMRLVSGSSNARCYSELVTFDNRLWAASGIVSDVRFRATCAVAGQLSAAQERVLGSDSGSAEPLTSLLGPSMHGPPYPCMYPCSQTHLGSDVKSGQPLENKSRAKRPREPPVSMSQWRHEPDIAQQCVSSSFPQLPEDLYNSSLQSNEYGSASRKFTKSIRPDPADAIRRFENHLQPNVQRNAAISAFRPETTGAHQWGKPHPGQSHTASAEQDAFPSSADVSLFSAALSARIQHFKAQQQLADEVELPFPGMHTLDLSFPFAQPACYEAAQQLMDHPDNFQAALTRCPLSQAEMQNAVIAADGYTYDAEQLIRWSRQHHAAVGLASQLTKQPLQSVLLLQNSHVQLLLQLVAAQRVHLDLQSGPHPDL